MKIYYSTETPGQLLESLSTVTHRVMNLKYLQHCVIYITTHLYLWDYSELRDSLEKGTPKYLQALANQQQSPC
jgi:hypothetical protein